MPDGKLGTRAAVKLCKFQILIIHTTLQDLNKYGGKPTRSVSREHYNKYRQSLDHQEHEFFSTIRNYLKKK